MPTVSLNSTFPLAFKNPTNIPRSSTSLGIFGINMNSKNSHHQIPLLWIHATAGNPKLFPMGLPRRKIHPTRSLFPKKNKPPKSPGGPNESPGLGSPFVGDPRMLGQNHPRLEMALVFQKNPPHHHHRIQLRTSSTLTLPQNHPNNPNNNLNNNNNNNLNSPNNNRRRG